MTSWVDGVPVDDATVPLADHSVLRGDGCFEALRSYDGRVFAVEEHLERLRRSAAMLHLDPPPSELAEWVDTAGAAANNGVVRVVVTRGNPDRGLAGRVFVLAEPLPDVPAGFRMCTVAAPWHSAGRDWALAGAKTISYAPNLSASRQAKLDGVDDAILLADDGTVLEGPTFTVGWITDGVVATPDLDLHILDSITRRHVLAVAAGLDLPVVTGRFGVDRLLSADEVFAMSTIKEVSPVIGVDDTEFPAGEVTARLREGLHDRIARLLG